MKEYKMPKLTQKNFDKLVESFNHSTTKIKTDLKWIKRIMYYMASGMTAGIGLLSKLAFT